MISKSIHGFRIARLTISVKLCNMYFCMLYNIPQLVHAHPKYM